MKRMFVLLSLLFCSFTYADTITINWGVDNQPYTTTTCEIGGDVVLPPVSKRGYVFRGWTPEHFNRGTFVDMNTVPTDTALYLQDIHNNRIPLNGDYIIVNNSEGYLGEFNNPMYIKIIRTGYGYADWVLSVNGSANFSVSRGSPPNNSVKKQYNGIELTFNGTNNTLSIYSNVDMAYKNKFVSAGKTIVSIDYRAATGTEYIIYYSTAETNYSGTWKFVYDGVWETDGKNGWKPDVQITSNQNE